MIWNMWLPESRRYLSAADPGNRFPQPPDTVVPNDARDLLRPEVDEDVAMPEAPEPAAGSSAGPGPVASEANASAGAPRTMTGPARATEATGKTGTRLRHLLWRKLGRTMPTWRRSPKPYEQPPRSKRPARPFRRSRQRRTRIGAAFRPRGRKAVCEGRRPPAPRLPFPCPPTPGISPSASAVDLGGASTPAQAPVVEEAAPATEDTHLEADPAPSATGSGVAPTAGAPCVLGPLKPNRPGTRGHHTCHEEHAEPGLRRADYIYCSCDTWTRAQGVCSTRRLLRRPIWPGASSSCGSPFVAKPQWRFKR